MTSKRIHTLEQKIDAVARAYIKAPTVEEKQRQYERFEHLEQKYRRATSEWYLMPHVKLYIRAREARHD